MSDLQPTWTGRTLGGRYRIDALLGRGGMSSVYKATDPNLQRTVAIKIIHPHLSEHPEFVKRFEQEAAAVARLRHPNIMLVHDFNHEGGVYYIVFEYIAGNPLDNRLKELKEAGLRLPLSETIEIMVPLCEAVAYAHENKMVHRDLKPSNVMINLLGQPILLDFGIAKIVGGGHVHTATGATIGTAAYMAPEQVVGDEVDHRADIYSLGVMLYEMACGRPPYEGQSALTVMMKHVNEPLPDIRLFNSNLPDMFSAVLEKALAKDPKERFSSALEMATALRDVARQASMPGTDTMAYTIPPPATDRESAETAVPPTKIEPKEEPPSLADTEIVTPDPVTEPIAQPKPKPATQKSGRNWLPLVLGGVALLAIIAAAVLLWPRLFPPELPSSAGMVQVPEGTFTIGADLSGSQYVSPQEITLESYWIDRFEVSNSDYALFLAETENEPPSSWVNGQLPVGQENHPVRGISWQNANDYCNRQNKRLPSEAEWEVAARGGLGFLYPWGDDPTSVSLPQNSTYASGSLPPNRSSFGVFDMAGNVWEWVDEPYAAVPEGQEVARGGAFDFFKDMAYRLQGDPNLPTMIASTGVRCAASEAEVVPDDAIVLVDDFTNPESGWPDLKEDNAWRGYHPPDYYHVEATGANQAATAVFGSEVSNVSMEARVFVDILETEAGEYRYGIILRQTSNREFYAFTVAPRSGEWAVLKASNDGLDNVQNGSIEGLTAGIGGAIQGGSVDVADTLRVDASGNMFSFFVNGRILTTFTDSSYPNGDFGFYVETVDETRAHVHYDNLTILELGDALLQDEEEAVAAEPTAEENDPATDATEVAPEPTATTEIGATGQPEATPEPTATLIPSSTPEPTEVAVPNGMLLIPSGSFLMGSSTGEANEQPEHAVTLDAYFIDQFEVSNEQYLACVADGGCTQTGLRNSFRRSGYRDDPVFANYPVMGITWTQANAYCEWAGKRLPTEAEWEFAASGPDNFTWPWGNEFDPALSAASSLDTEPVDDFPNGASPFGVFNMAGNVNEWVLDRFDPDFYANSPENNPVNLDSGNSQIYRGGSFDNTNGAFFTTSRRYVVSGNTFDVDIGFRCAQDNP
ncbi:SUMF1/EgtB/PvdO family nonheme iron enzyme [Candidatus Leptofilum sp.]|uniref:SUMF1/EgtB/PvdO family nonheme iron enzyme n=1 Tax=Candidatus Leptofilum sp. TaxID=3241576 RepID=UPI003B5AC73A